MGNRLAANSLSTGLFTREAETNCVYDGHRLPPRSLLLWSRNEAASLYQEDKKVAEEKRKRILSYTLYSLRSTASSGNAAAGKQRETKVISWSSVLLQQSEGRKK